MAHMQVAMQGPLQGYSDRLPQRVPMKGTKPHALLHVELASFTCLSKATLLLSRAGSVGPRVAASNSNFRIGPPDESVWLQLRELLGYTGSDPGHWNFSPEWWGSQDGGWGHNEGITIFNKQSIYNGNVTVTAHPASTNGFSSNTSSDDEFDDGKGFIMHDEWRVLRFNSITRQSVTRVRVFPNEYMKETQSQRPWLDPNQIATAYPECLAQEYLKSMVSVMASLMGVLGLFSLQSRKVRVLCIGLGGGSLPMFLLHHFPTVTVDAVEIDPVVIEACDFMGLRFDEYPGLRVFKEDAIHFLRQRISPANDGQQSPYDLIFIDAFDGEDNVPESLFSDEVSHLLASIIDQKRGAVIMNSHSIDVKGTVHRFAGALNSSLSFIVSTQKQRNTTLVIVHGLDSSLQSEKQVADQLRIAAAYVASEAGFPFSTGSRATRNLRILSKQPK